MKIIKLTLLILICISVKAYSQISGIVTDTDKQPIEFANVALYEVTDTILLKHGAVTDNAGLYKFTEKIPDGEYQIRVSFLGYKTEIYNIIISENSSDSIINFTLHADENILSELIVEGERPAMKVESGRLIYHIPVLLKDKPVTNAYDALKEIPGVMAQNEQITLLGTSDATILINGQKTSMTYEQLIQLLKSIPLSRVEDVEIMYSAPPSYNIRGAAINVKLRQQKGEEIENLWQGEMAGELIQRSYISGNGRASLLYQGKNTTVDAIYSFNKNKGFSEEELLAEHLINGTVYNINQQGESISRRKIHNARLAFQHTLENRDKVNISYTGMIDNSSSDRISSTIVSGSSTETYTTNTETGSEGPSSMHNVKTDYSFHFGLNMGADYTTYSDESDYRLRNTVLNSSEPAEILTYKSNQDISRLVFYANQSHQLKNNWEMNYGFNYSGASSKNHSDALMNSVSFEDASFDTKQKEDIWNFFTGFNKSFSQKLSLQASLAMEYYKSTEISDGLESILWDDFAWFPTLNMSYQHSGNHIFQLALSSDKTYPSYWSLNPNVYYISSYGVVHGNPHLRPMRNYSLGLTYIYKQKYVIRPYINHIPDYFVQLPYQSPDKLEQIFMEQNYTFRQNIGLLGVVPFNIGNRFASQMVANIMYWNEKDDDFYNIPFDRKTIMGILQMNNNIVLSNKPDLKMNISGYITSPTAIQGIYDLGASGDLSAGLTWTFNNDRAKIILKADDMFYTRTPYANIDFKGQKSQLKTVQDTKSISISFIYRFGGYKDRELTGVDTSRFGTN